MINNITISNLGVTQELQWNGLKNLNVIIGKNSTGKTSILKMMYILLKCAEMYKNGDNNQTFQEILSNKLYWTYQCTKLGSLVNKSAISPLTVKANIDDNKNIEFSFGSDTVKKVVKAVTDCEEARADKSVFIPAKEVLSLYHIILKSREQDSLFGFDDTYLDLSRALAVQPQRGKNFQACAKGRKALRNILGGNIKHDTKTNKWVFKTDEKVVYDIGTTSEGIKKIGIFDQLLANGYIRPNSVVFIDEPEASLHPDAISIFMELLCELSRAKIQIIMATHSYFVIKKLYVLARKYNCNIPVLSLHKNSVPTVEDLLDGMPDNSIIDEAIRIYEEELDVEGV